MADPDFYLCDVCGSRVNKDMRLHLIIGRELDNTAKAGSEERKLWRDSNVPLDLCTKHMPEALSCLVYRVSDVKDLIDADSLLLAWAQRREQSLGIKKGNPQCLILSSYQSRKPRPKFGMP